ncbi:ParA family protein [Kocuria sp. CPCC 205263]|uniref:ParA family protein n=1 Tax=Kocuria sp. CPCC 205263 TaxID=3073555 RepID=UPI0034D61ACF
MVGTMPAAAAGGVTKTTTAVSLAMVAAAERRQVVLIDLDPRAASSKWFGVEPTAEGMHVGAILGDENPEGWAEDLAVPSGWHPNLRVIPSARNVSNREADRADHAELPLLVSLTGLQADVMVIDCPNRQGGPLTLSALNAADTVVYAATATSDGIDAGGRGPAPVAQFRRHRQQLGAPDTLTEAGIVVGGVKETIMSRAAVAGLEELRATGLFLEPLVPDRAIVQEVRI